MVDVKQVEVMTELVEQRTCTNGGSNSQHDNDVEESNNSASNTKHGMYIATAGHQYILQLCQCSN